MGYCCKILGYSKAKISWPFQLETYLAFAETHREPSVYSPHFQLCSKNVTQLFLLLVTSDFPSEKAEDVCHVVPATLIRKLFLRVGAQAGFTWE